MTRLCSWLLLAGGLILTGSSLASAQAPGPAQLGGVTVLADRFEQVGPDNLFIATGNVEITRGSSRLLADRVEINRESGDAVAQGRVIFYDGETRLSGQRIDYNIKSGTGVVYDGEAHTEPYYRLSGERLERLGESVYRIRRGVFTTCEEDPPVWSFHTASATADLEDFVSGRDASFWVKNVPLIPWLPYFAAAIRRDRQTGFLFPRIGNSTRKGTFAQIPFFWAISDSQDATLGLDVYSRRGIGGHLEYNYILSESQRGLFNGFFVVETQQNHEARGILGLSHEWQIAPRVAFRADLHGVSDDLVLRQYGDELGERGTQRVESNVFLSRRWDNWNLVGNAFWYQDLTTPRPVELNRLPEIRLEGVRQPIPGLPGFLFQAEASAVRFVREVGSDGSRVDAHPVVSRPVPVGGYFTVTPFVGGRTTAYDRAVTGIRAPRGGGLPIEETRDQTRVRRYGEIGADFESRAARVYGVDGFAGFDSVVHSIEPRAHYIRIGGDGFSRLPNWTTRIDRIPQGDWLEYSVTNRLRAKTVAPAGTEPVRLEIVRLLVGHAYEIGQDRLGNVFGDLIIQPTATLRFRSDLSYNIEGGGVQSAATDVAATLPYVTANIGTRYSAKQTVIVPDFVNVAGTYNPGGPFDKGAAVNFLQGGLTSEVSRHLVVRAKTNLDMRTDTFVESRFGVDFRFQCWALSLDYINRSRDNAGGGENEIRFALNLLGLGSPIGTRIGGLGGSPSDVRLK